MFHLKLNIMKKFVKWGAFMLLSVALATNMTGCGDDDPDYENVTPPKVEVAPNTITGVITSISGDGISGATVTLSGTASATAQTDASGVFLFPDVKAGTYKLKAEADKKIALESEVTVASGDKSQNLVWNAVLASDVKTEVTVSATEDSQGEVQTETVKGNEKAEVKVEADIPAGAVDVEEGEDVKIEIAPIYDESHADTRAEESATMLVGATLACSKSGVTLKKSIDLGFNVDEELATMVEAKQYKNGNWVTVKSRVEDGKVIVEAPEFASYGLFVGVSFSATSGSEAINFAQNKWDNLYGEKDMEVGSATYTYKVGTEISSKGTTVLTALLIEKMAQRYGAKVLTVSGTYPINVTLPVGTMLTLSGTQQKSVVTVSAKSKSVSGTQYGTVTVIAATANRQHTGGGN